MCLRELEDRGGILGQGDERVGSDLVIVRCASTRPPSFAEVMFKDTGTSEIDVAPEMVAEVERRWEALRAADPSWSPTPSWSPPRNARLCVVRGGRFDVGKGRRASSWR